jgi:hypothetical protein
MKKYKHDFSEVKTKTIKHDDGSKTHYAEEVYRSGDFPLEEQSILHRDDEPALLRYKVEEDAEGNNTIHLMEERYYKDGKVNGTDTQAAWSKWDNYGPRLTFQSFYKDGVLHRGNNKPAYFSWNAETGEYDVQFWVDGQEVAEPDQLDSELDF